MTGHRKLQEAVPGYAKKVRAVPAWLKRQAYAEYGITQYKTSDYEVDHLIPLSLDRLKTAQIVLRVASQRQQPSGVRINRKPGVESAHRIFGSARDGQVLAFGPIGVDIAAVERDRSVDRAEDRCVIIGVRRRRINILEDSRLGFPASASLLSGSILSACSNSGLAASTWSLLGNDNGRSAHPRIARSMASGFCTLDAFAASAMPSS